MSRRALRRASGDWTWPVVGPRDPRVRPARFSVRVGPPGIDIAAAVGTNAGAAAAGTVTFAGPVGGRLFVTVDHGAGLESTYSWVLSTLLARRGDVVSQGQVIARSGTGHRRASLVPTCTRRASSRTSTSTRWSTWVRSRSGGSSGSRRSLREHPAANDRLG